MTIYCHKCQCNKFHLDVEVLSQDDYDYLINRIDTHNDQCEIGFKGAYDAIKDLVGPQN